MAEKKSILEEALLDVKKIQEALNANTKEILRSVAREEIDGMVKESLEEADYDEEAIDDENLESQEGAEDAESEDAEGGEGDEEGFEIEIDGEDSDEESDELEFPNPEEVGSEDDDQEIGMDADALGGDELDMTTASDDDVIAIYKKLSGEDEIEIVGDEIHLNISEPGEYIVKKGALGMGSSETDMEDMEDMEDMDDMEDEGMTYEIAMDDESEITNESEMTDEVYESKDEEEVVTEEDEESDNESIEEKASIGTGMSVGTHRNKTGPSSIGAIQNPKAKNESVSSKKVISETEIKYKKLLNESAQLKLENEEFRQALKKFRNMLVETVVFNSNLSYVTKLFMEHSTTKDEKKKIITRFDDEVSNLKESKKLYKTIVSELSVRRPMNEAVENKIIKEVATSGSKQLNKATVYVDPSTQRIKDLIKRVEQR